MLKMAMCFSLISIKNGESGDVFALHFWVKNEKNICLYPASGLRMMKW